MLGAIAGDIIGSRFEWHNIKTTEFALFTEESRFTDDTVLTVAQADSLLGGAPFALKLKEYFRRYPDAGYGERFFYWAASDTLEPYNSFGNGSGMRVSPVGWYFDDLDTVLDQARASAEATHNHPEGIKGAQAIAAAIFLARQGRGKEDIRQFVSERFAYDFSWRLSDIRPAYVFDVTCQGSVPQALQAFFESEGFEDAVRRAVSIGGDSDTIACMTGAVAEAFYGEVPDAIVREVFARLDEPLAAVTRRFMRFVAQQ